MEEKPKIFLRELTKKYNLSVTDKLNFDEVYSTSVSKLKLWRYLIIVFLVSVAIVVMLFFYTPLKMLIPGYPSNNLRELMFYNSLMVDSLEKEIVTRDTFLLRIQKVLTGGIVEELNEQTDRNGEEIVMLPMTNDSIFDDLIRVEKYKFTYSSGDDEIDEMSKLSFFTPLKGLVTNRFDAMPGHFGTDIVGAENSYISSVLDGTVVFAEWSVTTGYVIQIQHEYNLISVYKHNSDILVKSGDHVKAGDLIAIMGDEGEYSTGPHLHFELWRNGIPLDAENYISF